MTVIKKDIRKEMIEKLKYKKYKLIHTEEEIRYVNEIIKKAEEENAKTYRYAYKYIAKK